MINVKRPQKGQKVLQSLYDSVVSIIDYLPTLTVRGDNYSTYVEHASNGTVVHAKQSTSPDQAGGKTYFAGSGLTLSGNTFHNAVTSGRFIEVTSAYAINCTLSAGNNIEITPNGVINCTLTGGGGGGGSTYYADNFTLSTTTSTGNTFCLYDVYPLLTGRGGISVDRYGDAPLYPTHALGTVISCPVYLPSTGIAILDDTTPGTQNKFVAITADFDYNAGTGISIDPATRTINCTVEPGGGGETYYADESTIKLSSTNNTFYLYDVEPLLTGAGGIKVYNYGTDGLSRRVTGISATPYIGGDNISVDNYVISMTATIPTKTSDLTNDSGFITINDVPPGTVYQGDNVTIAASGTNNNIFYVINGVFAPLTTVVNLSTELSGHIDYVSSNIPLSTSELVNDVPFVTSSDLDAYYKVSAFNAVGDHLQYLPRLGRLNCTLSGGDWIQIDEQDRINCTLENVSDLNNDAGYITTTDLPPSTTYIGTSGIAIEPILDENQQTTTSSNIYISASFYNTLTNPTNDTILSCNGGNLCWVQNTGGSTPTPTPGGNTSQFALTSGAFSAEVNSEMIILTPTHIGNYDYPFKFWGFDQNNNFACGDEYPPSAVTVIDTLLNMTLTGSMFGYWNTSYQADVAIVLPNPTGPCTVKVKGFGSTYVAIVSNGKKIFSDITYYNPETFDNFANYPDETFEVSYYVDYMDCYSEYKQYLYLYVNSATGWAYNPNFYEHMVSAINENGGCWIRTEIK